MSREHYHKWTEQELGKLAHCYSIGGVGAVRKVMPHLTDAQISGRAKKLGIDAPTINHRQAKMWASLAPLDPESVEPSKWDNPIVQHKGVGQWKAEIPAVRWVFDLGAV